MRLSRSAFALVAVLVLAAGCNPPPCNEECGAGFHCDDTLLACVPDGETGGCRADADCSGNTAKPHCQPTTRACVACVVDGDCASGRCNPDTNTCVTGSCNGASDCKDVPGKPQCSAAGLCVECLAATDCQPLNGQRRTCDVLVNRCVANPCRQDADCSVDPGGRVCDTASGACVTCVRDEQCPVPTHGLPRCQATSHACVECLSDSDCDSAAGEQCNIAQGKCVSTGCASDAACAPWSCDASSRQCVACTANSACAFGGLCVNKGCAAPPVCAIDADCPWPGRCVEGACAACRDDGDCRAGQTCTAGACTEPATCTAATQCGAGRTCVGGACQPKTCAADGFEPNDDVTKASPLTPGTVTAALCPNEVDDYLLAFQEGAGATATITYDPGQGTPKLELLAGPSAAPQPLVATGVPGRLSATIESAFPGARSVLVRVSGGDGASRLAYQLETQVVATGACANDPREPDDTVPVAVHASPGVYTGTLCPLDSDFLAIDVPKGSRVLATFAAPGARVRTVSVEIYGTLNGQLHQDAYGIVSASGDATAAQPKAATQDTTAWVGVRNLASQKVAYTLTIDVRPPPPPNDRCTAGTPLALNASTAGSTKASSNDGEASCGSAGGDVFHTLSLAGPSKVSIAATADFPAFLSLSRTCDEADLACAAQGTDGTRLDFEALPAGDYVLRVDAPAGREGSYQLATTVVTATPPPTGEACASAQVLDLSSNSASVRGSLSLAANDLPAACGTDGGDAAYAFHLDEARHVKATLTAFPGASVTLVPAAGCETLQGALCRAQKPSDATAVLDRTVVEAGDWVLVVDGGGAVSGAFALGVELSEALYPPPNDLCDGALPLSGTVTGDTRGAADDFAPTCGQRGASSRDAVWRLELAEESEVTLAIDAAFDATLSIIADACGTGASLACVDGPQKRLRLPALAAGTYWVWVDGYAGGAGTYSLTATTAPAAPVPANDLCSAATVVDLSAGPATVTGATLRASDDVHPGTCSGVASSAGPDVVFAVDVPAGKALVGALAPDFDAALYVLDGCGAATCRAGSDQSFQAGGAENVRIPAGSQAARYYVVVDSWRAAESGAFSLQLRLE